MNIKTILSILLFSVICISVFAEEKITADDVSIPQGGETEIAVRFQFNEGHNYVSYQFKVELPEGISLVIDEYNKVPITLGDGQPAALYTIDLNATTHIVTCYSNPSTKIDGTTGVLVRIPVKANESLVIGTSLKGKLSGVEFSTNGATAVAFADAQINFTVVENRVILDETSTTVSENATGVNVTVKRTLNADEWTTICLPFAMSETQLKAAFGEDVKVSDFTGCVPTEDASGNVTALRINSTSVTTMEANHPYLICVGNDMTEFSMENVDIVVGEELSVDCDRIGSGTKRDPYRYNSLVGTYIAETQVPEEAMYMNAGKYIYSDGTAKILGYCGYFDFYDVLDDMTTAGNTVLLYVDNMPTAIGHITTDGFLPTGKVYTIDGRYVRKDVPTNRLTKGIYLLNGKKIVIK